MSRLENLIPPLELCKQIPAGEFDDSALVWYRFWGGRTMSARVISGVDLMASDQLQLQRWRRYWRR